VMRDAWTAGRARNFIQRRETSGIISRLPAQL
jgi:hypothetical protein